MKKFRFGTELFRKTGKGKPYFKIGGHFAGGDRFPLIRGEIKNDEDIKEVRDYMYPVVEK